MEQLVTVLLPCIEAGQEVVLTVTGVSMTPLLRHRRDQVVLRAVDPTALQPGDVPLYRRANGQYVLHRVVERDDGAQLLRLGCETPLPSTAEGLHYTLLGDGQTIPEPGVTPDQILAVATAFHRGKRIISCDSPAYRRRVVRWYRRMRIRPAVVYLYLLPGRAVRKAERIIQSWTHTKRN